MENSIQTGYDPRFVDDGQFTSQDLECTKPNGWFKPTHISFYLSWLLASEVVCNKQLINNSMILPHTLFHAFESGDRNVMFLSMYNNFFEKQERNIVDTSLVFLFLYKKKKWSLAVLLNLKELSEAKNQQSDKKQRIKPCVTYFALPFSCMSSVSCLTEHKETVDAKIDASLGHEETIENK